MFGIADTGADRGNSQAAWVQPRLAAGQPPALHIPDPDPAVNVWPAVAVQPPTSAIVAPPSSLGAFARGVLAGAARVFFAVARAIVGLVAPRPPAVTVSAVARTTTAVVGQRTVEAAAGARPLTFVAVAL